MYILEESVRKTMESKNDENSELSITTQDWIKLCQKLNKESAKSAFPSVWVLMYQDGAVIGVKKHREYKRNIKEVETIEV
jgi:hypothetical protein